jgi:hypothetical protein
MSNADPPAASDEALPAVSDHKRRRVRWIFLVVALLLGLQGLVLAVVEEPYPTFRLPDFRGSPDSGGYVERDAPVLAVDFADGSATVSDTVMFAGADAPDDLVAVVFPESSPAQRTGGSLGAAIRRYVDSFGVFRGDRASAPQTAEWLRQRLAELYPGRKPVSFQVRWTRERFTLEGVEVSSHILDTVRVPLTT